MRRRDFITGIAGLAAAWPLAARAQQSGRTPLVGALMGYVESDPEGRSRAEAFLKGLRELGWLEGQNIRIEFRWAGASPNRAWTYAKELVDLKPDVIIGNSTQAISALRHETHTIPIVFALLVDPVGSNFVDSLARPGGNLTGFTSFEFGMAGKWLGMLKEIAPNTVRVGIVFNPKTAPGGGLFFTRPFEAAARSLAMPMTELSVHDSAEIDNTLAAFSRTPGGGLVAMPDIFNVVQRASIISAAAHYRLPVVYPWGFFARDGGLVSYGADANDMFRRTASYVDRILKGEKAAVLPVQTPTKFELVINLKTAKTLGLNVPLTLQVQADEVIE